MASPADYVASEAAEVSQDAPEPDGTWGPPQDLAQPTSDGPFSVGGDIGHTGYYRDDLGECRITLGNSAAEIARDVEGSVGLRMAGFSGFKDGEIVHFKNGMDLAVWEKEIDCKDPPYDPLEAKSS